MFGWLRARRKAAPIPDELWLPVVERHSFLSVRPAHEQARLRELAAEFIARKEFTGAHGFEITDAVAVAVAAQAVVPVLHLGLGWYDDFIGIVIHPAEAVACREHVDEAGVVHHYDEVLAGEAMEGGPVMLSWQAVDEAAESAEQGYNVVMHEFIHKIDMRDGAPDGCPPLPAGFMGHTGAAHARAAWLETVHAEYDRFREKVVIAERFGGEWPWLDDYGAVAVEEFFAVAGEAFFVNRARFASEFPALMPLFEAFFEPDSKVGP
ncbi:MAG: zinc-dependent peptidase [Burkholderiales bacterium]|nr:zinc-dependent peptidase [Burkholderiales bacterium]